jgi:uncharacterized membrane protein YeaQ/YmgE (transglycosylase-associated protein family)
MVTLIIGWIVIGLIIGAIARLVVPGRQPIGILATILIGILGSVIGGIIAYYAGIGRGAVSFLIAVAVAAVLVFLATGTGRRSHAGRRW